MENLLLKLVPEILLALGLVAVLFLFVAMKREIHAQSRRTLRSLEEMNAKLQAAAQKEADAIEHTASSYTAPHSGFNLNKRALAVRLLRRGEATGHVAAALGVPEKEVELLIRVQRMAASTTASSSTGPAN